MNHTTPRRRSRNRNSNSSNKIIQTRQTLFVAVATYVVIYYCCCCCTVVSGQDQNNDRRLLRFLCKRIFFRRLRLCRQFNIVPPTVPPKETCIGTIETAADLSLALEQASTDLLGPPTVIEICTERIFVPATDNGQPATPTKTLIETERDSDSDSDIAAAAAAAAAAATTTNADKFGFYISFRNVDLRCNIKSLTDPKGRCILEAVDNNGIFYLNNSTLSINGFNITNGGSVNHNQGGAIYMSNSSTLNLTDTSFTNNMAVRGGAIFSNTSVYTSFTRRRRNRYRNRRRRHLNNKNKNKNSKNNNNETIGKKTNVVPYYYNIADNVSTFSSSSSRNKSNNKSSIVRKVTVVIDERLRNRIIMDGTSSIRRPSTTTYNIEFIRNLAWSGGAIDTINTDIIGNNIKYQENIATRFGGAVRFDDGTYSTISDTLFYNNYAAGDGGGIYTSTSKAQVGAGGFTTLQRTTFRNNIARLQSAAIDVTGRYSVQLLSSQIYDNKVNVSRKTAFEDYDKRQKPIVYNTFGSLENASAVRSLSPGGILIANTTFSENFRQPNDVLAHLYIHASGTAECNNVYFCGNRGLANTCSNTDFCTNCNQDAFSTIVPEGEGVCAFNETIPPAYLIETESPTFFIPPVPIPVPVPLPTTIPPVPVPVPVTVPVPVSVPIPTITTPPPTFPPPTPLPTTAGYPAIPLCFEDSEELRNAVTAYLQGDDDNSVKNLYGDPIGSWCVGNVTDFSFLFNGYDFGDGSYFNIEARTFDEDISQWNTSSAFTMENMFCYAQSFNQDLSAWDVSYVYDMFGMFQFASSFDGSIESWDVSYVETMNYMFYYATSFNKGLDLWDVSSVNRMKGMFQFATSFSGNLQDWDVSSVTDMSSMFQEATAFNSDLSLWDISNVIYMNNMFGNAVAFNQNLCPWRNIIVTTANVTAMFTGATSCPTTADPTLGAYPPRGPFCYVC